MGCDNKVNNGKNVAPRSPPFRLEKILEVRFNGVPDLGITGLPHSSSIFYLGDSILPSLMSCTVMKEGSVGVSLMKPFNLRLLLPEHFFILPQAVYFNSRAGNFLAI